MTVDASVREFFFYQAMIYDKVTEERVNGERLPEIGIKIPTARFHEI